jgi:hypothetical protein
VKNMFSRGLQYFYFFFYILFAASFYCPYRLHICLELKRSPFWVNWELAIDYRCDDGGFLESVSCVTISNRDLLSSSETGVNAGTKSWKCTYMNELDVRKPLVVSISQGSEQLTLKLMWFRIWQFQTPAWKWYLQKHLLVVRFLFLDDNWVILKEGVKTYLLTPMSPLKSAFFSTFTSIVYGGCQWRKERRNLLSGVVGLSVL